MPWVTGADGGVHCHRRVLDDGRQVPAHCADKFSGNKIEEPLELAALRGSRTAKCNAITWWRRGIGFSQARHPQVLSTSRGGTGGLETSCLAIGHAGGAIDDLLAEARNRPDLLPLAERLQTNRNTLRTELQRLATEGAATTRPWRCEPRPMRWHLHRRKRPSQRARERVSYARTPPSDGLGKRCSSLSGRARAAAEATLCELNAFG